MTLDGIMQKNLGKQVEEYDRDTCVIRQWGGAKRINVDPNFSSKVVFRRKKDTQTRWQGAHFNGGVMYDVPLSPKERI